MKTKEQIEEKLVIFFITVVIILLLPFCLLYLIFKFFATPFDYVKYKRSLYQKNFPRKYTWLREPHRDNEPYTAIKENSLPVEYFKWSEDYDTCGYFLYKDILLDFTEPFFFDKDTGLWMYCEEPPECCEIDDDNDDDSSTDECLTVEETREHVLAQFHDKFPERECQRVVFFYKRQSVKKLYGDTATDIMRGLDDFVIYEKGELDQAIADFIRGN